MGALELELSSNEQYSSTKWVSEMDRSEDKDIT